MPPSGAMCWEARFETVGLINPSNSSPTATASAPVWSTPAVTASSGPTSLVRRTRFCIATTAPIPGIRLPPTSAFWSGWSPRSSLSASGGWNRTFPSGTNPFSLTKGGCPPCPKPPSKRSNAVLTPWSSSCSRPLTTGCSGSFAPSMRLSPPGTFMRDAQSVSAVAPRNPKPLSRPWMKAWTEKPSAHGSGPRYPSTVKTQPDARPAWAVSATYPAFLPCTGCTIPKSPSLR